MTHAIRFHKAGGPDVLQWEEVQVGRPGPGEARVRNTAVGLNYVDTYVRSGLYPAAMPSGLGAEGAGVVEEVGPGVSDVKAGDRVAYGNGPLGAYSQARVMPADRLVVLPEGISDQQGAAMMLKGMTTQYLIRQIRKLGKGDVILFHAAAGGVGLIACQWAKALGATVIGAAGSPEKCAIARAAGCDAAIDYRATSDLPAALLAATGGRKARVVYDSVGRDTFLHSLDCAAPFGLVVLYGAASGPAPAIQPELLNKKGCLFLTRPSVFPHNADPATFRANAADVFDAIKSGSVRATIGARFPLAQVADAHRAAEARATTGAIVLLP